MKVEDTLKGMGLVVPNLEDLYRTNASGAHYISHFPVQGMLFLSGTVPIEDGKPYLPGVVGESLTLEQGYEAARYAALTTLAAAKYALDDLDRVEQMVHMTGFVNSAPGFNDQPRVINGAADLLVAIYGERGKPTRAAIRCRGITSPSSLPRLERRPPWSSIPRSSASPPRTSFSSAASCRAPSPGSPRWRPTACPTSRPSASSWACATIRPPSPSPPGAARTGARTPCATSSTRATSW